MYYPNTFYEREEFGEVVFYFVADWTRPIQGPRRSNLGNRTAQMLHIKYTGSRTNALDLMRDFSHIAKLVDPAHGKFTKALSKFGIYARVLPEFDSPPPPNLLKAF